MRVVTLSSLGISAALCLLPLPGLAQDSETPPPPKVSVAAAYTEEITDNVSFIGKGEAVDKVDIVARVEGFLNEVAVEDGTEVSSGDTLFRIEPDQYQAALAARNADLASAEANLKLAQVELDRKRQLVERQTVAQSELDVAQANEGVAEADIKSAEASIRAAELDLSYTEITAPFDGRIGRVERSEGDLVGPTSGTLATLVRETPIYVVFSLSEKQVADFMEASIAEGNSPEAGAAEQPVYVELANGSELDEVGKIVFADNRIDQATGTIAVRAEFENKQRLIIDGAFVNVRIEAKEPTKKLLIPQAAVQRDQKGDFVLVVNDQQTVEQRYITVGEQVDLAVVVTEGLREGETVIVEGLQRVRPGAPVQPVLAGTEE